MKIKCDKNIKQTRKIKFLNNPETKYYLEYKNITKKQVLKILNQPTKHSHSPNNRTHKQR